MIWHRAQTQFMTSLSHKCYIRPHNQKLNTVPLEGKSNAFYCQVREAQCIWSGEYWLLLHIKGPICEAVKHKTTDYSLCLGRANSDIFEPGPNVHTF